MLYKKLLGAAASAALVAGATVGIASSATAAPAPANLKCEVPAFKSSMDFPATADFTAVRNGANVDISVSLGSMPGIVPVPLTNLPVKGSATATAGGSALTLAGEHTVPSLASKAAIPTPVMTGSIAAAGSSLELDVTKVDFAASAMGMTVDVSCVAVDGMKRTVTFDAPAPVAVKPTIKATAKVNAKKVATVKVTAKGKSGVVAGKAKVTVKLGKKTVKSSTVTLKKGAASVKTKKLAKGKYTVTVAFNGSKAYTKATAKASFRVK